MFKLLLQRRVVLGSGSFASTDVGKRIVGNGGDVILTATSQAHSTQLAALLLLIILR